MQSSVVNQALELQIALHADVLNVRFEEHVLGLKRS